MTQTLLSAAPRFVSALGEISLPAQVPQIDDKERSLNEIFCLPEA